MTKKHFIALATALKNERPQPNWDLNKLTMWNACVKAVANEMWAFNTRFDRSRFIAACGGLFEDVAGVQFHANSASNYIRAVRVAGMPLPPEIIKNIRFLQLHGWRFDL